LTSKQPLILYTKWSLDSLQCC